MSTPDPNPSSSRIQTQNIAEIANNPSWTGSLTSEDPADKQHRLNQEAAENSHKRWRATVLFGFALLALLVIFIFAITIIRDNQATAQDKKWATVIMSSITTGLVGFTTGKAVA